MKKTSILILLFCISISLHSQILFNKISNPNNTNASAFNIFPVDSGYVCFGGMKDSIVANKVNIISAKYNLNGNLLYFKEYKHDTMYCYAGDFSGGGTARCKNGGFAVSCTQTDFEKRCKVILIRLNNNLDTIWTKVVMVDTVQFAAYHCIESKDMGIAMCGFKRLNNPALRNDVLFCKTDSMGNKIFEKLYDITIGIKGSRWDNGWNITETPDKGFLLGCYTYDNAYQGSGDGVVIKTDSIGNLLWMKNFGGQEFDAGLVTAVCNDSNYIVASSYSYYTADYNEYWSGKIRLTKINPNNGNTIWMREYFGVTIGMAPTKIMALSNGDFLISGGRSPSQIYNYSFILKVNANGDSLWCKDYIYQDTVNSYTIKANSISTFEITADNGIIACGEYYAYPQVYNHIWIFRTNEHGCLVQGCDVGINEISKVKGELQIFPNPATTQTTITYTQLNKESQLQIYNMLGQLVYEEKLRKGSSQCIINTTGFKPGMYKVVVGESSETLLITN